MSASTRWLAGVAVVVVLVLAAGIGAAALGGRAPQYAEGSPERAVQDYLAAVGDRDSTAAQTFFSAELRSRCRDYPRDMISRQSRQGLRATLERTTVHGDTAEVRVRITESYGDAPFNSNESSHTEVFALVREDGQWRFTDSPWPLYCPVRPVP